MLDFIDKYNSHDQVTSSFYRYRQYMRPVCRLNPSLWSWWVSPACTVFISWWLRELGQPKPGNSLSHIDLQNTLSWLYLYASWLAWDRTEGQNTWTKKWVWVHITLCKAVILQRSLFYLYLSEYGTLHLEIRKTHDSYGSKGRCFWIFLPKAHLHKKLGIFCS